MVDDDQLERVTRNAEGVEAQREALKLLEGPPPPSRAQR
jgi:hypothetical protein